MNNIPQNISDILLAYTSKKGISESQFNTLNEWIKTNPENEFAFSEYLLFYKKSRRIGFADKINNDKAWGNIVSQLQRPLDAVEDSKKPKLRFLKHRTVILKYAAIVIISLSVGFFYYQKNYPAKSTFVISEEAITLQLENGDIQVIKEDGTTQVVDATGNVVGRQKGNILEYGNTIAKDSLVYNIIKIPYGKRFELKLSDGTNVHLNSGSTLRYPVRFVKDDKRQVFLDGEAYFDVTKDAKHPFVVSSNDMDVKVLGTKFNITSYKKDEKTYAVLVEGSIAASSKIEHNDKVILKPGYRAYFEDKKLKTEVTDVKKYIAWVSGELMFIDDSFDVIANKLERKYNVEIVNNYKELDNIVITATFKNENIYQVLKTFQTYEAFDFTVKDRIITINKPKK